MLARFSTASTHIAKKRSFQFLIERLMPLSELSTECSTRLLWALAHGDHVLLYEQSLMAFRELIPKGHFEELPSNDPERRIFRSTKTRDRIQLVRPRPAQHPIPEPAEQQASRPPISSPGTVTDSATQTQARPSQAEPGRFTLEDGGDLPTEVIGRPLDLPSRIAETETQRQGASGEANPTATSAWVDRQHDWANLMDVTEIGSELQSLSQRLQEALARIQAGYPGAEVRLWCLEQAGFEIHSNDMVQVVGTRDVESQLWIRDTLERDQFVFQALEPASNGTQRSRVLVPIRVEGSPWGLLEMVWEGDQYSDSMAQRRDFENSGRLLEIAIGNQRTLEKLVFIDPLTGVYNRAFYERQLRLEIERSHRTNRKFGLLVMDVDDFKPINDEFGHTAGDYVLLELANAVSSRMRKIDLMFRYGGEEFVFLLPGAESEETQRTAERLRSVVAEHPFEVDGVPLQVTVSVGSAVYPDQSRTPSGIFKAADEALYRAKKQGKNRVVIA